MCFVDGAGGSRDGRHVRIKKGERNERKAEQLTRIYTSAWSGECLVTLPAGGGGRDRGERAWIKEDKMCVNVCSRVSLDECVCVWGG